MTQREEKLYILYLHCVYETLLHGQQVREAKLGDKKPTFTAHQTLIEN
jgi:hypothetical protein